MKFDFAGFGEKGGAVVKMLKKHWMLLAALVLGLVLLCLPVGEEKTVGEQKNHVPEFSLEAEEKRIAQALERIAGVGEVKVVLTLKSSVEQRVARDESTEYRTLSEGYELSSESSAVLLQGDEAEEPIVLKYIYPEYKGALIVADNVGASLRLEITNAVAALTGLSTDKISVVPGKI
ncbi:MAG: hypothetical protein IKL27_08025 [Oscillospiraceae bacterium]|nr:hypothetical protein [Oscillospiraceae bacterium]